MIKLQLHKQFYLKKIIKKQLIWSMKNWMSLQYRIETIIKLFNLMPIKPNCLWDHIKKLKCLNLIMVK